MSDKCVLRVLSQDSDLNYNVEIAVMRSGRNRNNWDFQNVEQYANTFKGVPILCAYLTNGQLADGHNMSEKRLPGGDVVYDFTGPNHERIVGAIGSNDGDVRTEIRDNQVWVLATGKLWRFYNWQLVDHIAEQGRMEVSAETEVYEEHEENGVSVFTNWRALGVTILHETVAPAIPGANIKALKELGEKFEAVRLAAASYHPNQTEPNKPQKNTNKGVKTQMYLSKQQLKELQKKFGENYAVLCAKQSDEGIKVLLMRHDNHIFCTYTIGEKDSAFDEGRVAECAAQITVKLAEDDELCADAAECIAAETAVADAKASKVDALEKELSAKDETIKTMQERESKRRLSAAKEAATRALSDFNAAREDVIADDILKAVNADIDAGVYACCANAEGEWTGASAVTERVLALCAQEQMKLDKASAMRKKGTHIMERLSHGTVDDGTVQGLLARKGIN